MPQSFGTTTQLDEAAAAEAVAAEIEAQGLALDESVALTSAASDFAVVGAAVDLTGGTGGEAVGSGSGALSDTSSGGTPVLAAVIGSMNSLD
jgi:hypothetical protein